MNSAFLVLVMQFFRRSQAECETYGNKNQTTMVGGYCYRNFGPQNFADAQSTCAALGMELPSFTLAFHYYNFRQYREEKGIESAVWLNLERAAGGSFETWGTGQPVSWQNWAVPHPLHTENCSVANGANFLWESRSCVDNATAVCSGVKDSQGRNLSVSDGSELIYLGGAYLERNEAEALCHSINASLPIIRSAAEMEILKQTIPSDARVDFWLDGQDRDAEGRWVWSDGSAVAFAPWMSNQPDDRFTAYDSSETEFCSDCADCLVVSWHNGPGYFDAPCADYATFDIVCQRRAPKSTGDCMEYEHVEGQSFATNPAVQSGSGNREDCARLCAEDPDCRIFQFENASGICFLSHDSYSVYSGGFAANPTPNNTFLFQLIP